MPKKWVLFCGGTGLHGALDTFVRNTLSAVEDGLTKSKAISLFVVVPMTDDGNSSRAVTDCFGGPALGDLRNVTLRSELVCPLPISSSCLLLNVCMTLHYTASSNRGGALWQSALATLPQLLLVSAPSAMVAMPLTK